MARRSCRIVEEMRQTCQDVIPALFDPEGLASPARASCTHPPYAALPKKPMAEKRAFATMNTGPDIGTSTSALLPKFQEFRDALDEHHERRERIIKASRDITAASKKIIFTLHRIRKLQESLPESVVKGNKQYYETIAAQFSSVSRVYTHLVNLIYYIYTLLPLPSTPSCISSIAPGVSIYFILLEALLLTLLYPVLTCCVLAGRVTLSCISSIAPGSLRVVYLQVLVYTHSI